MIIKYRIISLVIFETKIKKKTSPQIQSTVQTNNLTPYTPENKGNGQTEIINKKRGNSSPTTILRKRYNDNKKEKINISDNYKSSGTMTSDVLIKPNTATSDVSHSNKNNPHKNTVIVKRRDTSTDNKKFMIIENIIEVHASQESIDNIDRI